MIIDAVVMLFLGLLELIIGLLPSFTVPTWLDVSGPLGTIFGYASGLGAWVPMQLAFTVLSGVLGLWAVAYSIKFVRMVASFFSGGGGSAA